MKKAQMALFIILGIVLIFIVAAAYLSVRSFGEKPIIFEKGSIQMYMDGCLKESAEEGIILLGKQGGRIALKDQVKSPSYGISLWLKENKTLSPSVEGMEQEIGSEIEKNIKACVNGFDDFTSRGWKVEQGEFSAQVMVNRDDVSISAQFPITIIRKEESIQIGKLSAQVPVRLSQLHEAASEVAQFSKERNNRIDLTYLNSQDFNTTIFPYAGAIIYRFTDEKSRIGNAPYEFYFAIS